MALERACNVAYGCLGQLLLNEDAADEEEISAEPIAPLLQIMEGREPHDAGGMEGCIWTEVKCMGRVHVTSLESESGSFTASASQLVDGCEEVVLVSGSLGEWQ